MAYTQIQKIENPIPSDSDQWGIRTVVDGYHMIVARGASTSTEVYKRDINGVWQNQGNVPGNNGLSMFANYFTIARSSSQNLDIYNKDSIASSLQTLNGATGTATFGNSVAIGENYIVVGDQAKDSNTGQIFVYEKTGTDSWTAYANNPVTADALNEQDFFGSSVAVTDESIIVGVMGDDNKKGAVYIFQKDVDTGVWEQTQKIFSSDGLANDQFGESISASEDHFVVGASLKDSLSEDVNSGAAYVFKYSTNWFEVDKLASVDEASPEGDHFGESVYINGDHIIVGSPAARMGKGVADVFYKKRSWGHLKKLTRDETSVNDDELFGSSVSVSGRFIAVGSPDYSSASIGGSVYIYEDPSVRLRLAQEFEVNSEYLPSKASVYLKRVGSNTSNFWPINNTSKTVIDATNFSTISDFIDIDSPIELEDNTIAQYKMNDNLPDTNVVNSIGSIDATYVGANTEDKSVPGKINTALLFDTLKYANTNQNFQTTFEDSFSINFWTKPILGHPGGTLVIGGFFISSSKQLFVYYSGSDIVVDYNEVSASQTNIFPAIVTDFHMLTFTFEIIAGNVTITTYFDGSPIGSPVSGAASTDMSGIIDFYISALNIGGAAAHYSGSIDNFCIFNKTLSQDEIDFLYNNGSGGEYLSEFANSIIFEDSIGGFTGNGYMISKIPLGAYKYKTLNYPIRAINPDTYDLWMRVINIDADSLEIDILIDGVVSKTISTEIDNPSDGLEWSWVNTTLVLPDNRDHILGIRIKENNVAIDKIYIEVDSTTPYTEGPDLSVSPYLTTHMRVYDKTVSFTGNTVAQYKMNDNLATTNVINEFGTDGTNQVNTNLRDATGKINGAVEFHGASFDYVDTNQSFESVFQDSFSVNLWAKLDDGQGVFSLSATLEGGPHSVFEFSILGPFIYCTYWVSGVPVTVMEISGLQPGQESWHMFTAVVEKTGTTSVRLTVYIDKEQIGSPATINSIDMSSFSISQDFPIGASNFNGNITSFFSGDLDNFCIFNKVITQDEIDFLYNDGFGTEELENNIPNSSLFIYDYKNSITEIIQDDWYNFNIKVLDDTHGYTSAVDFTESYFLVMATSGTNTSNFITWELINNDEQINPSLESGSHTSSAIKF